MAADFLVSQTKWKTEFKFELNLTHCESKLSNKKDGTRYKQVDRGREEKWQFAFVFILDSYFTFSSWFNNFCLADVICSILHFHFREGKRHKN